MKATMHRGERGRICGAEEDKSAEVEQNTHEEEDGTHVLGRARVLLAAHA
jgi:hypothetical protein